MLLKVSDPGQVPITALILQLCLQYIFDWLCTEIQIELIHKQSIFSATVIDALSESVFIFCRFGCLIGCWKTIRINQMWQAASRWSKSQLLSKLVRVQSRIELYSNHFFTEGCYANKINQYYELQLKNITQQFYKLKTNYML